MTADQFARERDYRVALTIAEVMLANGILSPEEYEAIIPMLVEKFSPIFANI